MSAAPLDNWQIREVPLLPAHLYRIAFGNGTFVANGSGNTVLRSTNGQDWSRHPAPFGVSLDQVEYSFGFLDGRFFVNIIEDFEGPSSLYFSTNGLAWNKNVANAPARMVFGNGVFVGLGEGGLRFSTNALNWISTVNDERFSPAAIAFGGGQFVVVGNQYFDEFGYLSVVMTSTDGLGWTYTRIQDEEEFYNLAFGNGRFVAEGSFGFSVDDYDTNILASSDGIIWTKHGRPDDFSYDFNVLIFGGGLFVATAQNNTNGNPSVLSSADGIDWQVHAVTTNSSDFPFIYGLAYGLGTFVAVGESSLLAQSDPFTNAPVAAPAGLTLRQYPGLTITGTVGGVYAIQATADVTQSNGWQTLHTLTLPYSPCLWFDTQADAPAKRFYRAVAQ
ncbi:MAG TPA: hypothetical protein VK530_10425 [Candidatus Acidoferrum sp.]|nr:hypothetical protein [Candidatus Acidoferrum sp.]